MAVECPSADGVTYAVPGSTKVFKRECNVNFVGGEGDLGLQNATVLSMTECLNLCAQATDCVAVNFNYQPQCWLKQYLGTASSGDLMESAYLVQ